MDEGNFTGDLEIMRSFHYYRSPSAPSVQPQSQEGNDHFFDPSKSRNESFFETPSRSGTGFFSASTAVMAKSEAGGITIGSVNDPLEKEADSLADQVVSGKPASRGVQRCPQCGKEKIRQKPVFESDQEEAVVRRKCKKCEEEEQHRTDLRQELTARAGRGQTLSDKVRQPLENAIGADFQGVRIHNEEEDHKISQDIHAQAFTYGQDIYFNQGKYDPGSTEGKHLLAHELTHVKQQTDELQRQDADTGEEAGSCPNYSPGEVSNSRTQAGLLAEDVTLPATNQFLVADFGNNRTSIKASTQGEVNFIEQTDKLRTDRSLRMMIEGFSDCSGGEEGNTTVRQRRASSMETALGGTVLTRISFRGMAALNQFVTTNDTPENRAMNRSVRVNYKPGFFFESEAVENAAGSETAIQTALNTLGTSDDPMKKNIPQFLTEQGIFMEALTPRHDTDVLATDMEFFAGHTDYSNTFTLPAGVRFHIHSGGSGIAVQVRAIPIMEDLLPASEIEQRIVQAVTQLSTQRAAPPGATTDFENYRAQFNGWWVVDPYATMSSDLDLSLNSKGPRTQRSREIFNRIYHDDSVFRASYDANLNGFKERVDSYQGPDSLNMINSPRLQNLRNVFDAHAAPVASADYPAFRTSIQTASNLLDASDRQAIDASNEWQLLINTYLPVETRRQEIRGILRTAPPAPAPPVPPPAPPGPPPSPGAAQAFLDHIVIETPTSPVSATHLTENLTLTPKSDRVNPGLNFKTQLSVNPSGRVTGNALSPESVWPTGTDAGVPFVPEISTTGNVTMTAHLELKELPAGTAPTVPVSDATVQINDDRLSHLLSTWTGKFSYNDGSGQSQFSTGATINYQHGTQNFRVFADLPGSTVNPGLTLSVNASVKRGSAVLQTNPTPQEFPANVASSPPIALNIPSPATVPATGDPLTIEIDLLDSGGAVVGTRTISFNVHAERTYTRAQAIIAAKEDDKYIHDTSSAGLLGKMILRGGVAATVAQAIQAPESAGGITLLPMTTRHDSADFVTDRLHHADPSKVGYFVGISYLPLVRGRSSYPDSMVGVTGAAAFSTSNFPHRGNRVVILNRTTDVPSNSKRTDNSLIMLLVHEATHAMDNRPDANTSIERYKTEFRAYWNDGRYGDPANPSCTGATGTCFAARFDPSLAPPGPKSPRARAIFSHLYGSPTYDFVKPAYDNNVDGFRQKVDNYLIPDGINLAVSQRLELLRGIIEGYTGANFADLRRRVREFTGAIGPPPAGGALSTDDQTFIRSSRAWRDLVDRKLPIPIERNLIKSDLSIPQ